MYSEEEPRDSTACNITETSSESNSSAISSGTDRHAAYESKSRRMTRGREEEKRKSWGRKAALLLFSSHPSSSSSPTVHPLPYIMTKKDPLVFIEGKNPMHKRSLFSLRHQETVCCFHNSYMCCLGKGNSPSPDDHHPHDDISLAAHMRRSEVRGKKVKTNT